MAGKMEKYEWPVERVNQYISQRRARYVKQAPGGVMVYYDQPADTYITVVPLPGNRARMVLTKGFCSC